MELAGYLEKIDSQAKKMYGKLIKEFSQKQGVTEQLKAKNQLLGYSK